MRTKVESECVSLLLAHISLYKLGWVALFTLFKPRIVPPSALVNALVLPSIVPLVLVLANLGHALVFLDDPILCGAARVFGASL